MRTIQDEINELKRQVKSPVPAKVSAGGADGGGEEPAASPVEGRILQLTEVGMCWGIIPVVTKLGTVGPTLFFEEETRF